MIKGNRRRCASFFGRKRGQYFFKDQAGCHPHRKIIQSDKAVNAVGRAAVIPGTDGKQPKQASTYKFNGHDANGINASAQQQGTFAQMDRERTDDGSQSVNGKHPDRSMSG